MAQNPTESPDAHSLEDFLDADTLRDVQNAFTAATGAQVCFYDHSGRLIRPPGEPRRFCSGHDHADADQTLGRAAAAACRGRASAGPVELTCCAGRRHLAAPIRAGARTLGLLVLAEDSPPEGSPPPPVNQVAHAAAQQDPAAQAPAADSVAATCPALALAKALADLISRLCHQDLQLRLRIEELGAIYGITGMLAGPFDLEQVLVAIARRVGEVMRVRACSVRLFNADTGELVGKAVYNLSPEYLSKGAVRVAENPIDAAALAGQTVYIEDVPADPRVRYPEEARREGIVSGLVAGMFHRGKPIGVIRVYTGEKHRFSAFEAGLLRAMGAQAASAIETARFYQEALQAERVRKQVAMASDVQRRMIPARPPVHPRLAFGTVYEPSLGVGGDFFDFLEFPDGRLGVAIADVVGKGIPAALMMASVRSVLRATAFRVRSVAHVVDEVNRHLFRDTMISEFATLFYCVFNRAGTRLNYCNAGHNPPLVLRGGEIFELTEGGMVIGIRHEPFAQSAVALQSGDVVLLYTDGITEAADFRARRFGADRLRESLRKYGHLDAAAIARNVLWDVRRFVGLAEQSDDQTMVAIKVR